MTTQQEPKIDETGDLLSRNLPLDVEALFVGATTDGHLVAYTPECLDDTDTVRAIASTPNAWLRRIETDADGTLLEEISWLLPSQENSPLTPLYESPAWDEWDKAITDADDMTVPEYSNAVAILHQFMEHGPHGRYVPFENLIAVTHDRDRHEFTFYEVPALHPALGVTATDLDTPAEEAARAWLNVTTYGWSRDPRTHDVSFAFLDESSVDITSPGEDGRTEIEKIIGGTHPSRTNILRTDRPPLAMLGEYLEQVDAHNESALA